MPVVAVGLITDYDQAEAIIGTGDADFVALARGILYDPRWPWHAAAHLGASVKAPNQYLRSQPRFSARPECDGPDRFRPAVPAPGPDRGAGQAPPGRSGRPGS
jgi:tRNA-dihydrouridine synthase